MPVVQLMEMRDCSTIRTRKLMSHTASSIVVDRLASAIVVGRLASAIVVGRLRQPLFYI